MLAGSQTDHQKLATDSLPQESVSGWMLESALSFSAFRMLSLVMVQLTNRDYLPLCLINDRIVGMPGIHVQTEEM